MKVLITGATGFIGRKLMDRLLPRAEKIYILIRPSSLRRWRKVWGQKTNVEFISADITQMNLFDKNEDRERLKEEVDTIIHMAALYDLQADESHSYMVNVVGTQNILNFSSKVKNLKFFHYVSTMAVCGDYAGIYPEQKLLTDVNYENSYGLTKMVAEKAVRETDLGAKKRVYRPGIVIADSRSGKVEKMDGPYYFLSFLYRFEKWLQKVKEVGFLPLPFSEKTELPIIPVDLLITWLEKLIFEPVGDEDVKTYHLVSENTVTVGEFLRESLLDIDLDLEVRNLSYHSIYKPLFELLNIPREILEYMYLPARIRPKQLKDDYKDVGDLDFHIYKKKFFEGAKSQYRGGES